MCLITSQVGWHHPDNSGVQQLLSSYVLPQLPYRIVFLWLYGGAWLEDTKSRVLSMEGYGGEAKHTSHSALHSGCACPLGAHLLFSSPLGLCIFPCLTFPAGISLRLSGRFCPISNPEGHSSVHIPNSQPVSPLSLHVPTIALQ